MAYGPAMAAGALSRAVSDVFSGLLGAEEAKGKIATQSEQTMGAMTDRLQAAAMLPHRLAQLRQQQALGAHELEAGQHDLATRRQLDPLRIQEAERTARMAGTKEARMAAMQQELAQAGGDPRQMRAIFLRYPDLLGDSVTSTIMRPERPSTDQYIASLMQKAASGEPLTMTEQAQLRLWEQHRQALMDRYAAMSGWYDARSANLGSLSPAQRAQAVNQARIMARNRARDLATTKFGVDPSVFGGTKEQLEAYSWLIDAFTRDELESRGLTEELERMPPPKPMPASLASLLQGKAQGGWRGLLNRIFGGGTPQAPPTITPSPAPPGGVQRWGRDAQGNPIPLRNQ